jgi:hypothetical protein
MLLLLNLLLLTYVFAVKSNPPSALDNMAALKEALPTAIYPQELIGDNLAALRSALPTARHPQATKEDNLAALRSFSPTIRNPQAPIDSPNRFDETSQTISRCFDFSRVGLTKDMKDKFGFFLSNPNSGQEVLRKLVGASFLLLNEAVPPAARRGVPFSVMQYLEKSFGSVVVALLITPGSHCEDVISTILANLYNGLKLARSYILKNVPGCIEIQQGDAKPSPPFVGEFLMRIESSYGGRRYVRENRARYAMGLSTDVVLTDEIIGAAFESIANSFYRHAMRQDRIPTRIIIALKFLRKAKKELEDKAVDRMEE